MRNNVGCELCDAPANMYCESDRASLCWRCDNKVHGANFLVAKHSRCVLCHHCQAVTPWTATGPKLPPSMSLCLTCVSSSRIHTHNHPTTQLTVQSRVNDHNNDRNNNDNDDDNFADSSLNMDEDEDEVEEYDNSEDEEQDYEDDDNENQVVPLTSSSNNHSSSDEAEEEHEDEEEEEDDDDDSQVLSMLSSPSLKRKRESFVSLNL